MQFTTEAERAAYAGLMGVDLASVPAVVKKKAGRPKGSISRTRNGKNIVTRPVTRTPLQLFEAEMALPLTAKQSPLQQIDILRRQFEAAKLACPVVHAKIESVDVLATVQKPWAIFEYSTGVSEPQYAKGPR
jgi:hypothetical protein